MWRNDKMRLTKIDNEVIETYKYDDYIIEITKEDDYYNGYVHESGADFRTHIIGVQEKDFLIEYISGNIFRIIADYQEEALEYEAFAEERIDKLLEERDRE